jgi:hypothetical protein
MLSVVSGSVEAAVMCTESPAVAFSDISLASASESTGAWTGASFASVIDTVNVVSAVDPSALVAVTVTVQLVAVS